MEPPPAVEFRFLREFRVIGPFPLEMRQETDAVIPPGFVRQYPAEREINLSAAYYDLTDRVRWQRAVAGSDGRLDLRQYIIPSDNAVAYAHAVIIAAREMKAVVGLGSNDGARLGERPNGL